MVLRVFYYTDEAGERWAVLLLLPIEPGISFEYAASDRTEATELPA